MQAGARAGSGDVESNVARPVRPASGQRREGPGWGVAAVVKSALTGVMDRLIPAAEDLKLFLMSYAGGLAFFGAFLA